MACLPLQLGHGIYAVKVTVVADDPNGRVLEQLRGTQKRWDGRASMVMAG